MLKHLSRLDDPFIRQFVSLFRMRILTDGFEAKQEHGSTSAC